VFRKVLVANRGEIAVRIVRALRDMGMASVAVYSDADRASLAVSLAEEAAHLGPSPSTQSYLAGAKVIAAARRHGADAIHPGYGFLSENAEFAAACREAGIAFIGPGPEAIRAMGSKIAARRLAVEAGVGVVPGAERPAGSAVEAAAAARRTGYPVLLKAAAGGGGKGMRRVDREEDLESALRDASSEAARAFGDGSVYVEKLVVEPRHIEIQVLGDLEGRLVHLGERECSIQRRHQKLIEECPSPATAENPDLRRRMGEAALRIARHAGYTNAGTMEFLAAPDGSFQFLEMNTRLQVEHPVTELVTGIDLVQAQIRLAAGEPLWFSQEEVGWRGWAVEGRICAEDAEQDFLPSAGRIEQLVEPAGPGIRVDSGVYSGWRVPVEYDSLLAKLIGWGGTREEAVARLRRALWEYYAAGIRTNAAFLRELLGDPEFAAGRLSTTFLDGFFSRRARRMEPSLEEEAAAALAAAAIEGGSGARRQPAPAGSGWLRAGREAQLQ
jgi:acetyl-CoA carboxylase biotin carboxylase subunit